MSHLYFLTVFIFLYSSILAQETNPRIDSLSNRLTQVEGKDEVDVLNQLGKEWLRIAPDRCLKLSQEADSLAKIIKYKKGEVLAIEQTGIAYMHMNVFDTALYFFVDALKKYEDIDDQQGKASSLGNIGSIYSLRREYQNALENYSKALHIYEGLNDLKNIANLTRLRGIVYGNLYKHPEALIDFHKAIEIATEIGEDNIEAYALNNIAIVYGTIKNYEKAIEYYLKAIDAFEKSDNQRGTFMAKANLSGVYANIDKFDSAINLSIECVAYFKEINNKPMYAMYLSNTGMMYSEIKEYKKALEYLQMSLPLHRELKLNTEMSHDLLGMAVVYKELNKPQLAINNLSEVLNIAAEKSDYWALSTAYINLSELNATMGNPAKALDYFKLYKSYNDSVNTQENQEKLTELEVQYETEKKEKENLLLQQEVQLNKITIQKKNIRLTTYLIIIFSVIALLIIVIIFYRQKSKSFAAIVKQNLISLELEKKLDEQNQSLSLQEVSDESESDKKFAQLKLNLSKFLNEEKPWLWADVTMEEFCRKLETNRTYLSQVINEQYKKSFTDLMCEYRIRTSRELLSNANNKHITVEGIGEMSGFKNNTTFHRQFKNFVNLTPKQFREKALK